MPKNTYYEFLHRFPHIKHNPVPKSIYVFCFNFCERYQVCEKQCDKLWCVVTADGESVHPPPSWIQAVTLFTVHSANFWRLYWSFWLKACAKLCLRPCGFLGNCWSLVKRVLTERRKEEWGLAIVVAKDYSQRCSHQKIPAGELVLCFQYGW